MNVPEQIAQLSQALPPEKQAELLDFAEFLVSRQPYTVWTVEQRREIAELALKRLLPSMCEFREHVEAGALMSYGQNLADGYRRTATFVDKIFKGRKPAELPITIVRRGSVGPIKVEAVGLPSGVTATAVVSEPSGPTAGKVTLSLVANGAAFSGPIRIIGTTSIKSSATPAKELHRSARTPAKLGATFETIWMTAIAKP